MTQSRRPHQSVGAVKVVAIAAACGLTVAACGSSTAKTSSAASNATPKTTALDPTAAAALPASIRSSGVLVDGVNAEFAPFEYKTSGGQIVGLDIDLATQVAKVLGLRLEIKNAGFPSLIPGIQSGRYQTSASALTDNQTREAIVSFVDYAKDGTSLMVAKGNPKHLSISTLCGQSVAVNAGSSQAEGRRAPAR